MKQKDLKYIMIKSSLFFAISLLILSLISCSPDPQDVEKELGEEIDQIQAVDIDRFIYQFIDISEIATIRQLSDLKRDYRPCFNSRSDRIMFNRLLEIEEDEGDSVQKYVSEEYYSMDFKTGKMYILSGQPEFPEPEYLPADSLPSHQNEKTFYGIKSGKALYYTAADVNNLNIRMIYQCIGDSLTQLTFGKESSFLQRVSPDGRFVAFLYDGRKSILVVYDNQTQKYYSIPKDDVEPPRHDYAAVFSPDSKYLVFLRAGELYKKKDIPYGDIWLIEFDE